MEIIAIRIKEKNGVARISETVRMRFSLPKSDVQATIQLAPKDGQKLVIVQLEPHAYWTGGCVRRIHSSFLINVNPGSGEPEQ